MRSPSTALVRASDAHMVILESETLPAYDTVLAQVEAAEHESGWLAHCADAGQYLALNRQFVDALASVLCELTPTGERVLEVCAGDGALASALRTRRSAIIATDANPPSRAVDVLALPATVALLQYRPTVVLGSFVPSDGMVHEAILSHYSVQAYVVLGAQTGHDSGIGCRVGDVGWTCRPLPTVTACMVSRHDVWLGEDLPLRRKGEAWVLLREADFRNSKRKTERNQR